ncbi:exodeoxyribonuclease VII small subunit [Denitrificimonas sp. JX-1]|uniref:Exodeoxyribonuclease 7 small subunit n=1 Tax=Denitrificimonas halotolerans TaxID=3098930 RepID=A0ABU5GT75_9GAMM|nr:exodeoxyribonuclease VII small subunit [Denitrificimonas sp. JX-1]MDY7219707.1 exodeoxyribonuclease VII small subunit [Denitrificimonas sp. JX-1]
MARQKKLPAFEQSLSDLQALVERLESGDLSLEESLATFEKGIALTRECQSALQDAEQRVQVLLEQNGTLTEQTHDGSLLP